MPSPQPQKYRNSLFSHWIVNSNVNFRSQFRVWLWLMHWIEHRYHRKTGVIRRMMLTWHICSNHTHTHTQIATVLALIKCNIDSLFLLQLLLWSTNSQMEINSCQMQIKIRFFAKKIERFDANIQYLSRSVYTEKKPSGTSVINESNQRSNHLDEIELDISIYCILIYFLCLWFKLLLHKWIIRHPFRYENQISELDLFQVELIRLVKPI